MNDVTNNPFDLPFIDKEDIPVLDDIIVPGSVHENRTPVISEHDSSGLADYSFDIPAEPADEQTFHEELAPEELTPEELLSEEIAKETSEEDTNETRIIGSHTALDTGFTIERQNSERFNETNITEELHIDQERLTELIDQITTEVQQKFKAEIEGSIRQAMEDSLNSALNQHKELIKESIHTHLMEQLPGVLHYSPVKKKD